MANPIDSCEHCGAKYARFRGGVSVASAQASILASRNGGRQCDAAGGIYDHDTTSEDLDRVARNAAGGMLLASKIKRDAWHEAHGPGRCCFDVEGWIMEYRRSRSSIATDHAWRLRELIADLLLGEDEDNTADDDSGDVEITFDPSEFDAVPEYIDDGNATTCIAA